MKLEAAHYVRALKKPFRYGARELVERKGIYLRATTDVGVFYGEISPLPGHSQESLEDCQKFISNSDGRSTMPASIRFALSGLDAQRNCVQSKNISSVISNAMISGDIANEAERALDRGYSTLKLKVFPENYLEIPTIVKKILHESPSTRFRLDANQSLSTTQLHALVQSLLEVKTQVEYIEEPTMNCWAEKQAWEIPLAADESANSLKAIVSLQKAAQKPDFFIIKPSVLGGIFPMENTIVTSALETEAGRRSILAQLLMIKHKKCAGVSTGFLFQENFLEDLPVYDQLLMPNKKELDYYNSLSWERVSL